MYHNLIVKNERQENLESSKRNQFSPQLTSYQKPWRPEGIFQHIKSAERKKTVNQEFYNL